MGISRLALWRELGVQIKIVEPLLFAAYEHESEWEIKEGGRPTTSLYLSNFPGDDPLACGRYAVYSLMSLPGEKFSPKARAFMNAGKAVEQDFVSHLAADGLLLSGDEAMGEKQTKFEDPATWASGATDAIILPSFWRKSHVVEIKGTSAEKIAAMKDNPENTPWSHKKYIRQIKVYIALANAQGYAPEVVVCEESWAITKAFPMGLRWCPRHHSFECQTRALRLDPPEDGTLIYSSRDDPLDVVSYYFEVDLEFLQAGRRKLAEWRDYYLRGMIPAHPHEGKTKKWSVDPCRLCALKPSCKIDFNAKEHRLAHSAQIPRAKEFRPAYDYDAARAAVFARWGVEDPLLAEQVAA